MNQTSAALQGDGAPSANLNALGPGLQDSRYQQNQKSDDERKRGDRKVIRETKPVDYRDETKSRN